MYYLLPSPAFISPPHFLEALVLHQASHDWEGASLCSVPSRGAWGLNHFSSFTSLLLEAFPLTIPSSSKCSCLVIPAFSPLDFFAVAKELKIQRHHRPPCDREWPTSTTVPGKQGHSSASRVVDPQKTTWTWMVKHLELHAHHWFNSNTN